MHLLSQTNRDNVSVGRVVLVGNVMIGLAKLTKLDKPKELIGLNLT